MISTVNKLPMHFENFLSLQCAICVFLYLLNVYFIPATGNVHEQQS